MGVSITCPTQGREIRILGDWEAHNIVKVYVPQIAHLEISSYHTNGYVRFHRRAVGQLIALWEAWEEAGLLDRVTSWYGSHYPRFTKQGSGVLSLHSYGAAFDINVPDNGFEAYPPAVGQRGSVRELVSIANEYGFYWGGHWDKKYWDGMHFEVARLL